MRKFVFGIIIFFSTWLLFATFQWPNGLVRVFTLMEVEDTQSKDLTYLGIGKRTFKLYDDYAMEIETGQISIFEDCFISNRKNWLCFRKERKSKFGMADGEFFDVWLREQKIAPIKTQYVSELTYHLNGCSWDWRSAGLQLIACPLRPFFDSY